MTLLQAVGEILRPTLVQRGNVQLEETDVGSTCKAITLHKSGQALVLRPDLSAGGVCPRSDCAKSLSANDRLFPLFRQDVPGLAAMCDYIVFCQDDAENDDRLFVLLCELKSRDVKGSRNQIEKGMLLADYIVSTAMNQHPIQQKPRIERRGLVFSPKFERPKGSLQKSRCQYQPLRGGYKDLPFAYYKSGTEYPLSHFCS